MTRRALRNLVLALCLIEPVIGQFSVNLTDAQTTVGMNGETTATTSSGGCICEGRGELLSDYQLDFLPEEWMDYLQTLSDDLPENPTCGDVQALYPEEGTECPTVEWMDFCCTAGNSYGKCASNIRGVNLEGYDKLVIPTTSYEPTTVNVQMTYHTVTDIAETKGTIEIFCWIQLDWIDPRLAWEYENSEDGACTALPVNYRAEKQQGLKDSEIWVPEFDLYNQVKGVTGMTGQLARVHSNGHVKWLRQGTLKAICKMENLGQIPFDPLGCQLLMGHLSSGVQYQLNPEGGLVVSGYSGPYNGYKLKSATPGFTDKGDAVFFSFEFTRGSDYYITNVIIPICIFSFCSIGTMLVGVGAFQTIALNFTLLLTSVAQRIAISNLLPITNEKLWIVDFVSGSFYFIVFTLCETFFKFIILQIRVERKKETDKADEEGNGEGPPKSCLPDWFYTFSTRKLDVYCAIGAFVCYWLYLIIFFSANKSWGGGVQTHHYVNGTSDPVES